MRGVPKFQIFLAVVAAIVMIGGVSYELFFRDDDAAPAHRSITAHKGTLHWTPRGPNPAPQLSEQYWTWSYPAAYSSRVDKGVGVYFRDERIGFVEAKRIDRGTVWVYAYIAPEFQHLALNAAESEPIETKEGPRIQIYRLKPSAPGSTSA